MRLTILRLALNRARITGGYEKFGLPHSPMLGYLPYYVPVRTLFRRYEFGHTKKTNPLEVNKTPRITALAYLLFLFAISSVVIDYFVLFEIITPELIKRPWKQHVLYPYRKWLNTPIYPYNQNPVENKPN